MQINPHSLGFDIVADIGIFTTIEKEIETIQFLTTIPFVVAIHPKGFGKYNLGVTVVLKNFEKLSRVIERLEANQNIKRVDTFIWAEIINMDHTQNVVIKPSKGKSPPTQMQQTIVCPKEPVTLDQYDKEIIKRLMFHSRTPFSSIAKEIGISTANVIQRYKRIREIGALTLSTITVDLRKFGYKAMLQLFVKVKDRSKSPEIYRKILEIPNVITSFRHIGGPDDFRLLVAIEDFEDIFKLRDQIRRIKGIEETDLYVHPVFHMWPLNIFASLIDPKWSIKNFFTAKPKLNDNTEGPSTS